MSQNEQLIEAAKEGDLNKIEQLVALGCDVRSQNNKALKLSAYYGHVKIHTYLLSTLEKSIYKLKSDVCKEKTILKVTSKKILLEKNTKKHKLLKHTLKPKSLHIQTYFI